MLSDVPEGWSSVALGDVIRLEYGRALAASAREAGNVPVYGSNGICGQHSAALVNERSIVVGRKGTAGSVTVTEGPFWPIDTTYFVVPRVEADFDWLAATLEHARLSQLNEATGVPGLNRDKAYVQPILLPPLDEQRRIAEVLRAGDEALELARNAADQHLALWEALAHDLIWRPALEDDALLAPMARSIKASDYGVNAPLHDQASGFAVLRMGNIQQGQIDLANIKWGEIGEAEAVALKLRDGDILFNRTNSRDLVGKVALVRGEPDYIYASYLVRLSIDRATADPYFVFAAMNSRGGQARIRTIATPGVSQSNINPTNLKKLLFPLFNLELQREISTVLQGVEAAWLKARHEVERLRALRISVSSSLLSGRVRVPA
ncbi:restriction endonuclease subunit S [Brevundimonas intermedia]|uniref:restriction endonuclease subunit S n=1 Tax=Brevundimonas intermedia TaxID=74315 RepID=UPI00320B7BD2